MTRNLVPHSSHWGAFEAEVADGTVVAIRPYRNDPDPSPLLGNIVDSLRHPARVTQPMIRAGWLDRGPGADPRRGAEPFVPVSWPTAVDLLAGELRRVYAETGGAGVYGGSYGWSSAGRFHHAQSQLHRFLNCLGGYVRGEHSYSNGAQSVIMPHVVGSMREFLDRATAWSVLERHTELFICFGGIPLKNTMVSPGGASRHPARDHLRAARARGAEFVLVSPLRDDSARVRGRRVAPHRPGQRRRGHARASPTPSSPSGSTTATSSSATAPGSTASRATCSARPTAVRRRRSGRRGLSEIPASTIRALARRMAAKRTLINVNYSLQRVEHGEQAPWLAVTLAAMLGQIGLPGGGFGQGYGSLGYVGRAPFASARPRCRRARTRSAPSFPFARLADMLLQPGEAFDFDGTRLTYPDIRLVYWCGGNPFHHHQHLARLRRALARPATIVVHESFWTPMARHADIVLPATMTLERNDIGGSPHDACLIAMRQAVEPWGEARSDFAIFADLAAALGRRRALHRGPGRDGVAPAPLRRLARRGRPSPRRRRFDEFWAAGFLEMPEGDEDLVLFKQFRADPEGAPLGTPSGRIEIFSATIDGFGYEDCPGHPTWLPPTEWLGAELAGRFPLHLVANNPTARLHSQLDVGGVQPVDQGARARADPDPPGRCRGPRHPRAATWCACSTTAGAVSPAPW